MKFFLEKFLPQPTTSSDSKKTLNFVETWQIP